MSSSDASTGEPRKRSTCSARVAAWSSWGFSAAPSAATTASTDGRAASAMPRRRASSVDTVSSVPSGLTPGMSMVSSTMASAICGSRPVASAVARIRPRV